MRCSCPVGFTLQPDGKTCKGQCAPPPSPGPGWCRQGRSGAAHLGWVCDHTWLQGRGWSAATCISVGEAKKRESQHQRSPARLKRAPVPLYIDRFKRGSDIEECGFTLGCTNGVYLFFGLPRPAEVPCGLPGGRARLVPVLTHLGRGAFCRAGGRAGGSRAQGSDQARSSCRR